MFPITVLGGCPAPLMLTYYLFNSDIINLSSTAMLETHQKGGQVMNLSNYQTIDFILKEHISKNETFMDKNLKVMLKCDNDYIYGDLLLINEGYVIEKIFDFYSASEEIEYINIKHGSDAAKQIEEFSINLRSYKTDNYRILSKALRYSDSLHILQKYILRSIENLEEENKLPALISNAHILNSASPISIPFIDLDIYDKVNFVSIIEL